MREGGRSQSPGRQHGNQRFQPERFSWIERGTQLISPVIQLVQVHVRQGLTRDVSDRQAPLVVLPEETLGRGNRIPSRGRSQRPMRTGLEVLRDSRIVKQDRAGQPAQFRVADAPGDDPVERLLVDGGKETRNVALQPPGRSQSDGARRPSGGRSPPARPCRCGTHRSRG